MFVVSLVGARPQFVKVAPVHFELSARGIRHEIIHSGQHYDERLSADFFDVFGLPKPRTNLLAGSGRHAEQTAKIMVRLDEALDDLRPDVVLLYGDTNTTLAGAVVASKRAEFVVHIEAGLRSFNSGMPEEVNRVAADHLSHLLLAPTEAALANLGREGLEQRSHLVGDVMVDALRRVEAANERHPPVMPIGWNSNCAYVFATLHRAENTDDPNRLKGLMNRLGNLGVEVRLAAHPRLVSRLSEFDITCSGRVTLWEPLSYPQTVAAITNATAVVTDSGGLQKEAALLACPCITVRHETEWTETVLYGWNTLAPNLEISVEKWASRPRSPLPDSVFGDGRAAERIVDTVIEELKRHRE